MKADEAYQCGKCGLCLPTCPVYRATREETTAPRAKVQLIKNFAHDTLPATNRMKEKLQCCLMCGACTNMCPGGVQHDILFMRMRQKMGELRGRSKEARAAGAILPKESRMRLASKAARIGTGSLAQRIIGRMRIGNIPIENFPGPNTTPFRGQVPEIIEPVGKVVGQVVYFTGCATNHIFERTGHACIKVLTRMGYRVLIPPNQGCCGLPLFFHGDIKGAEDTILSNIDALHAVKCDAILVDCATCGSALGHAYPLLMPELDLPDRTARSLAEKVWDISEFVFKHFSHLAPHLDKKRAKETVTYHQPCHLKHHGHGRDMVADLLKKLAHVDYQKTDDWDACCGGGGFFFNEYPDISNKIVENKIKHAVNTGAQSWTTGCPGCRVQLSGHLPQKGLLDLNHPMEIIARGLKTPG